MSISTEQEIQIALSHHQAGRLAEAEGVYRHVLNQQPHHATALNMFGVLAVQSGRPHLAIDLLNKAIAINPSVANYHCNLGESLRRLGRLEDAIASYREALRLKPDLAVAHNNLGIALAARGEHEDAITAFRSAIRLAPGYAEAHNNLGNSLKDLDRVDDAIAACRNVVLLKPTWPEGFVSLGVALARKGKYAEAIEAYQSALTLDPKHAEAHSNLGNALAAVGKFDEALAQCESAVKLDPNSVQAHWNFAVALLRYGDFARGWTEYEWRWKGLAGQAHRFDSSPWDGSALNGKTILLHAEQGFGDAIQFVRYAPLVAQLGGRVLLECLPELVRLFQTCEGVAEVIARGSALPAFDTHAPLMSLPRILGTRLETIPQKIPYLSADPEIVARWKQKVQPHAGRLNVGLAWSGSPLHSNDRNRSIPLTSLAPLSSAGVTFHSVQDFDPRKPHNGRATSMEIVDHSADLTDFAETAGLLANLDLLITVDTAVAHLAGAMGIETWLLLPYLADWRWLTQRDDSPWYPTVKLFRQSTEGDWHTLLRQRATALAARVASGGHPRMGTNSHE